MPNSAQHVLFSIHYLLSTIGRSTQNLVCTFFKKQIVLHEPLSLRLERNACANDWLLAFEFRIWQTHVKRIARPSFLFEPRDVPKLQHQTRWWLRPYLLPQSSWQFFSCNVNTCAYKVWWFQKPKNCSKNHDNYVFTNTHGMSMHGALCRSMIPWKVGIGKLWTLCIFSRNIHRVEVFSWFNRFNGFGSFISFGFLHCETFWLCRILVPCRSRRALSRGSMHHQWRSHCPWQFVSVFVSVPHRGKSAETSALSL